MLLWDNYLLQDAKRASVLCQAPSPDSIAVYFPIAARPQVFYSAEYLLNLISVCFNPSRTFGSD